VSVVVEIPKGRHARRVFFVALALAVLLLLGVKYFAIPAVSDVPRPSGHEFFDSMVTNLVVAIAVGAIIGGIVLWLLPERDREAPEIIAANDRGLAIEEARLRCSIVVLQRRNRQVHARGDSPRDGEGSTAGEQREGRKRPSSRPRQQPTLRRVRAVPE
jgi:hypothetical protein